MAFSPATGQRIKRGSPLYKALEKAGLLKRKRSSPGKRRASPRKRSAPKRKRSALSRRKSPKRRSASPRKRKSPKKRSASPRKRKASPKSKLRASPRKRKSVKRTSPRKRASPRKRRVTPRRCSAPKRKSPRVIIVYRSRPQPRRQRGVYRRSGQSTQRYNTRMKRAVARESGWRNRTRPSPTRSAAATPIGTKEYGNDGSLYRVALRSNGTHFWRRA